MYRIIITTALGLLLLSSNVYALELGVGVKAGTIGKGVDLSVALTKTINARISITSIDVDDHNETIQIGDTGATGDIDATLGLDFGATALLFDWYIFDGTFHLTAGMMKNDTKLSFSGTLLNGVTLDGQQLDPSDISGEITGNIGLGESYQPYLGVGWGRKAGDGGGFAFSAEIGVALLDPAAEFSATTSGSITQDELDARLRSAEADANADLSLLEAWPVITIGLNYGF